MSQDAADREVAQLKDLLLGGRPRYTRERVAELADVPLAEARRLWRSMGYADVGSAVAFRPDDLDALRLMDRLIREHALDDDTATDLVRGLGQTASRLAEWQVNTLLHRLAADGQSPDDEEVALLVVPALADELTDMAPVLQELLGYVWRRKLASAIERVADVGFDESEDQETGVLTVAFADMVGYTRLSRQLPSADLAALVSRFEAVSADVVAALGGRLVKTVGDEILFVTPDAATAAGVAIHLHATHAEDATVPEMRIGMATGEVVSRMGDVFGTTVNLASRLTALADPGTTLVDEQTRQSLLTEPGLTLRAQPPRPVRGMGVVRPFMLGQETPEQQ